LESEKPVIDFARVRTFTCGRSTSPAVARSKRPGGTGGARPGMCNGHRPADYGTGNHGLPPPPSDTAGQSVDVAGGWARETASSGQVSGAMAHLSKSRHAARRRDAIVDRMLGMGDHRPTVGHGWMMAVGTFYVCSYTAVNSDLSCFLYTL